MKIHSEFDEAPPRLWGQFVTVTAAPNNGSFVCEWFWQIEFWQTRAFQKNPS